MNDIASGIRKAKAASIALASLDTATKDAALEAMASALASRRDEVLAANRKDIESNPDVQGALLKRLKLDADKIDAMVEGVRSVKGLKDPVGETMSSMELDDGLMLYQVRCPIGMIGVIFEARPEVVPQILSLCVKSGNGVVFKGGREALESNRCIFGILMDAVKGIIPTEAFVMLETREDVDAILGLSDCIDLLIPRGSNAFVRYIQTNSSIPVLGHSAGICHVYVDSSADIAKAKDIVLDSKIQYPAACNAAETLLVNSSVAASFLPEMGALFSENGVEVRCDAASKAFIPSAKDATDADWDTEYNDNIISVRMVDSIGEAIDFINTHGSHHTDTIVTEDHASMLRFCNGVDSADVFVNASTRFSDGFRFGKGAEIGISTNKIHSRGPVGMEGLMIYKYIIIGNGQVVKDYSGSGAKKFKHRLTDDKLEMNRWTGTRSSAR